MVLKKTFFSLLNAAFGALLAGFILFLSFSAFFESFGLTGFVFHERLYSAYLPTVGVIILLVLIFVLLDFIKKKIGTNGYMINIPENVGRAIGTVIFVFEIALGLYLIFEKCSYLASNTGAWLDKVGDMESIGSPYSFSGNIPEHIYHLLTGFVFSVFGEKPFVYLILGTGLWFFGAFFSFFAVKAFFGVIPALVSYIMLFVYACIYTDGYCFLEVQDNIMFVITTFIIMVIALILKLRHDGIMISSSNAVFIAILGLILGFISSFYPGVLFAAIPVLFALIFQEVDFTELDKVYENAHDFAINKPLLPTLTFFFSTCLGFLGFTAFNRMVHGYSFEASIQSFIDKVDVRAFSIPNSDKFLWFYFNNYIAITIILGIFALFAFLETFFSSKDRASLYLWCIVPTSFILFFSNITSNADLYLWGIVSALASNGLLSLFRREPIIRDVSDEDYNEVSSDGFLAETAANAERMESTIIEIPSEDSIVVTEPEEPKSDASESEPAPVKTIVLFDNPLPLPKKHEKKEIKYDFDVPEYLMKFDVDINSGDDFDI